MAQFYFLSILMNILAGLILVFGINLVSERVDDDFDEDISESDKKVKKTFGDLGLDSLGFRMVTGILCVFVALMKILSVFRNDVPVIGDLIPAFAGFAGGASILLEYYVYTSDQEISVNENVQKVFIDSRKIIGYICFAAAVMHFVFPQVLFL